MDAAAKAVLDNIYARRSIRAFDGRAIDRETIDLLLKAAMAAPSACNLQPWEFIIVDTPEGMQALKPLVPGGQFDAPMAMVVCARTEYIPWPGESWRTDCAAAIENMMLLARALGIGSLWIGDFKAEALAAHLNIPGGVEICNVVYFGYPQREKKPVTRYKEEAVYWGAYDPERPHAGRTTEGMIQESIDDSYEDGGR